MNDICKQCRYCTIKTQHDGVDEWGCTQLGDRYLFLVNSNTDDPIEFVKMFFNQCDINGDTSFLYDRMYSRCPNFQKFKLLAKISKL